ncbi:MAG: T9SS type A sorting domain-containing protein [Ignavibacterium album]|nr:T9SS type A sorting domain-containing protein [Ignavibacterium album]
MLSSNTEWTEENFEPIPARYVRIVVHSNNQNNWASLWETEFYGQLIISGNEDNNVKPDDFELEQNYPNPFNPSTKISWQSPVGSWQTLKVFDILGNEVATLVNEYKEPGRYEVEFDASDLASGVYIYRLQADGYLNTRKMILLR